MMVSGTQPLWRKGSPAHVPGLLDRKSLPHESSLAHTGGLPASSVMTGEQVSIDRNFPRFFLPGGQDYSPRDHTARLVAEFTDRPGHLEAFPKKCTCLFSCRVGCFPVLQLHHRNALKQIHLLVTGNGNQGIKHLL